MAHYGKSSVRLMSKIRNGYATYLRNLASVGTREDIMEYVNSVSVRMDVETVLSRTLTQGEACMLLATPEETELMFGRAFGIAHVTALNLKHHRQALRSILRQHRMQDAKAQLERMARFDASMA